MRTPGTGLTFVSVILLAMLFSTLSLCRSVLAGAPTFDRAEAIRAFVSETEKHHLTPGPLDSHRAALWFDRFLEDLDPQQMYFLAADYARFQPFRSRMHDLARRGDTRFADEVRRRYVERVRDACSYAATFLTAAQDFSADEEIPRQYAEYAAGPVPLRERWRLRIKAELLVEKAHGTALSDARKWLGGRYRRVEQQAREMTDERLCEIYLNALAAVYDPHTAYLSPRQVASFTTIVKMSEFTTGLTFRQRRGRWVISSVRSALADRRTRDRLIGWELLAIQRLDGTMHDVVEMPGYDFGQMIRSPWGPLGSDTEVILELQNPATLERRTLTWIRRETF